MEDAQDVQTLENTSATMRTLTANLLYQTDAELGEGALWDERISRLWWVDILKGRLHRFDPETKTDEVFEIGMPVSTVVPEEGREIIITTERSFARYSATDRKLEVIAEVLHSNSSVRFNDGKCDPNGRLWAGTMAQDGTPRAGMLYCLEGDSVSEKLKGVSISNGIGWSPSGDIMYYVDTPTKKVVSYDFDRENGAISSQHTVLEILTDEGAPDGMCIDSEGMLWVALWDGGKVIRIDPKSESVVGEVIVPGVSKVTSCALGGDDMCTLFITTARQGFTAEDERREPAAGSLFSARVDVRGVRAHRYKSTSNKSI